MITRLARLPALPAGPFTVAVARGRPARALGLAGLRMLPGDVALLLPRCRSVHTLGMRVAVDLVWLGADGAPVRLDRGVPPARIRGCRSAAGVLEVAAGRGEALRAAWAERAGAGAAQARPPTDGDAARSGSSGVPPEL